MRDMPPVDWQTVDWRRFDTDKATTHRYHLIYPTLFDSLRAVDSILEIGVDNGGSLCHWATVFPSAQIVGLDLKRKPDKLAEFPNIEFIRVNAYQPGIVTTLDTAGARFSMIIDDGSHRLNDMCFVLNHYLPLVESGGYLVLEDIQSDTWCKTLLQCLPNEFALNYFITDFRFMSARIDDLMLVVRKLS